MGFFYRLGLFAVRFRNPIIGFWLLVALVALPFVPGVPRALSPGGFSSPEMESYRAIERLRSGLNTSFNSIFVIFTGDTLTADDPRFVAQADAAVKNLESWGEVARVIPYTLNPGQVATDRHAAYTAVFLTGDPERAHEILPEVRERLTPQPDLAVELGGGPVFFADIQSVSESDLRRAEIIAFPFAAVALLIVFRSVIAAAVPALVGGVSVVISLALLYLFATLATVSTFALNITTLFGLGLGVDYSLFVVSRFREELARQADVPSAVAVSMATAGRAVFFSGLAVSIGLFGLVLFPLNMLHSVGLGGMITVALSVLAASTLLPALLGVLGEKVNALPIHLDLGRLFGRRFDRRTDRHPGDPESGFWHRLALAVMRYPLPIFFTVLAFLLLLGSPYLRVRLAAPDASILPPSVKSRAAYDLLSQRFEQNSTTPIILAVDTTGSPLSPENVEALDTYVRRLQADSRVARVDSIVSLDPRLDLPQYRLMYSNVDTISDPYVSRLLEVFAGRDLTMIQVISKTGMLDPQSEALVQAIRNTPPPPGMRIQVDGSTAGVIDYVNTLYGQFPRVLLVVALTTYLVLMLLLRSVILPLKALLMNTLSIVASYGALVFIFQEGNLSGLLGFTPLGFVEASGPILMFCALFGLSMDYEVFLLSRIREAYEATGDNTRSVALGLEQSGRIITSAAAIVIIVSLAFATASMVIVKALGIGMALAVLLDATLVRGLLVPSTMRLLGSLNWWWPKPLERLLPSIRVERSPDPTTPRV